MSKHNYTQYSAKKTNNYDAVTTTTSNVEPAYEIKMDNTIKSEVEFINETVDTVTLPETVTGTVVDCSKLNIRVAPNIDADIACVLDVKSEIEIDVAKSTDEWFYICTAAGIEGYCMRKFVDARL